MYVCYCQAVTDHVIKDAIGRGARSISELASECGAGDRCRGCWPALQELLADSLRAVGAGAA